MIIRNRNRGIKLVIKYNADGIYVGESFVHLTKLLRCIARTMVPIRYNTWRDVPEQLKDKLWDSIEIIEVGSIESIDRSLLWKRAMQKKNGSYDDVVILVVEKIDELMKESQESGISYSGSNDILAQALSTPEYTGRVRAKGKHYMPRQYFNRVATPQSMQENVELAIRTKENIVAGGTIVMDCGPNYLVALDAPYESNTPLPIPFLVKLQQLEQQWATKIYGQPI
ncbi:hypothetical protein CK203_019588 [Vitis vinifera]|uniref:Uncharacterized protein n=1 Tax=Vitis vinifera TaxID=29760 RepID=A0A438JQZ8_VITVI|nr:hypothetical protein CK203_019588 [Vitis vinifera]